MSTYEKTVQAELHILREYNAVEGALARREQPDPMALARLRELIAELPNARTEFRARLAELGTPATLTDARLPLTAVGRVDAPLANLDEPTRYAIVEEAIAQLQKQEDPQLLAAALAIAAALPNRRDHWEAKLEALEKEISP